MELSRPFIRLPWSFDADRMAEEIAGIDAGAWMQHPSRLQGNSAVALISREGGDNDDFEGRMAITEHLRQCPYLQQVIASFGEVLGRSRLMKLAADNEVATHVDFNYHWHSRVRIHVPIVTNSRVTFHCADRAVYMRAGECWIFNSWRRHRVTNESDHDRVHLVVDLAGSAQFWDTVREMETMPSADNEALEESQIRKIDYVENASANIRTEQYNVAPVMSPGELDALVNEVVAEFDSNPENDRQLVDRYKKLLFDLRKNWRELWLLHGYQRDGWPHYRMLLDSVQKQLHPDRRALVTSSNKIGVNPIIVQRILRPALTTDAIDQFVGSRGNS